MSHKLTRSFIGLDLAPPHEYTALAVVERPLLTLPPPPHARPAIAVRHLHRFPLGTPYRDITTELNRLLASTELRDVMLVVDATAVGQTVVETILAELVRLSSEDVQIVTLTSQRAAATDGTTVSIPRRELVGLLQILMQARRLQIASSLPHAALLIKELESFRAKATLSQDAEETWREGRDDDLILAMGLACWLAEETLPRPEDIDQDAEYEVVRVR